jgi:ribonuclease III
MTILSSLKRLFSRPGAGRELEQLAENFHEVFQYDFKDEALLLEALVHRSYIRTAEGADLDSYERLEFLGDSVLGLIVAEQLYLRFPEYSEGELTKLKSLLVNETSLARIGGEAGLGEIVRLSPDEERSGGRKRQSIIADCFEAALGAIYLDGSIEPVREVVNRLIISRVDDVQADKSQINYKGHLLEFLQSRGEAAPQYDVIDETGPDHRKIFSVAIKFRGETIGVGEGAAKKEAEQKAAREGLQALRSRFPD